MMIDGKSRSRAEMDEAWEHGAFMEKFTVHPTSSSPDLPLKGLAFAIKDIFDVEGHVATFGNPDWAKTHPAATSTAPAVKAVLDAGATSLGITVMDEMAYSINGENIHYGTPENPCAPDRVPGGSSSGSAVAVAAKLVDFSLGTDTGGSVRVPASYCGVFGFRPSHDAVSNAGVIPMSQSFDTVGWFARDPEILSRVGRALLNLPKTKPAPPRQVIVPEDCFLLSSLPRDRIIQPLLVSIQNLFGGHIVKKINLGGHIENTVPSLKHFVSTEVTGEEHNIPSLAALSTSMRLLQRFEFKKNHGEWITSVKPGFGPGISERVQEALRVTDKMISVCRSVKEELRSSLSELLQESDVLVIPTVPGPPPKLRTEPADLENFRARAFSLLSIAGVSRFCQVSIPLGLHDNLPVAISLLARHGSDGFLLGLVETLYDAMRAED